MARMNCEAKRRRALVARHRASGELDARPVTGNRNMSCAASSTRPIHSCMATAPKRRRGTLRTLVGARIEPTGGSGATSIRTDSREGVLVAFAGSRISEERRPQRWQHSQRRLDCLSSRRCASWRERPVCQRSRPVHQHVDD
jgi:hypothetical protein